MLDQYSQLTSRGVEGECADFVGELDISVRESLAVHKDFNIKGSSFQGARCAGDGGGGGGRHWA